MRTACSTRRAKPWLIPLGGAAIEAERVLVEVGGEVLLAHRAVVGAQQPALDEVEDEMDAGQPERGVAPGRAEIDGLVVVALGRQAEVAAPAVGGHGRRLGDVGGEEGVPGSRPRRRPAGRAGAGRGGGPGPRRGLPRPPRRPGSCRRRPGRACRAAGHRRRSRRPRRARPGARGRGGPWPCGACAARSRRSGSCPSPAAARARWRRSLAHPSVQPRATRPKAAAEGRAVAGRPEGGGCRA